MEFSAAVFSLWGTVQSLVETGQNLVIAAGGMVYSWDGLTAAEQNFHVFPEAPVVTTSVTSGGHLLAQPYQYVACYEWLDARGQVVRSAPSLPTTYTPGGANYQINVAVNSLALTQKNQHSTAQVVVYATTGAGTIFYRIGAVAVAGAAGSPHGQRPGYRIRHD